MACARRVDIAPPDEPYRAVHAPAGLAVTATPKPRAAGEDCYACVSKTAVAPWVICARAR